MTVSDLTYKKNLVMSTSIKTRIKNKIDTAENWSSAQLSSYVLLSGEIAFEKNTSDNTVNFKVGDGQHQYSDLPYAMTKTYVKDPSSQEYADGKQSDLSVIKLSKEEYANILHDNASQPNALYIISSDFKDAYGQQVKNMAPGTDLSDAVSLEQLQMVSAAINTDIQTLSTDNADIQTLSAEISSKSTVTFVDWED